MGALTSPAIRARALATGAATAAVASALLAASLPHPARAGGYDTPMLYSARHIGMGGTAVAFVDDPSALFHNPAGLGHTRKFAATGDFSLLLARVHSSPAALAPDLDSELTVAPLFLLGAGYRINELIALGLAVFPNASAGATYKYEAFGANIENTTRLVFIEATPAISFNLPGRVRLGAGYRITYVNLQRYQGDRSAAMPVLDFDMTGVDWTGFRVGAQWTALDWLQVGAVYRHKTTTTVRNDEGVALSQRYTDIETDFVLPSKLGAGVRADLGDLGLALDAEHLWNSQNTGFPLQGLPPMAPGDPEPPMRVSVDNVFEWSNEITLRAGAEYRLLPGGDEGRKRLALRLGYVFDGPTTNERYPSAFGTPPGPTHVFTAGAGWRARRWQVNLAYAHRTGSAPVRPEVVSAMENRTCRFCSIAGMDDYSIAINAFYLDLGFVFD
jgi:long-subunit fatty acid transport protein